MGEFDLVKKISREGQLVCGEPEVNPLKIMLLLRGWFRESYLEEHFAESSEESGLGCISRVRIVKDFYEKKPE